jgi:hypothetical protein
LVAVADAEVADDDVLVEREVVEEPLSIAERELDELLAPRLLDCEVAAVELVCDVLVACTLELLDPMRELVDEAPVEEEVSATSGIGSVSVANGLALMAIVQEEGVAVAEVDVEEGVALQPITTDVLVVQLLLKTGVPDLVVDVTGVHDTQLLVTVLVVHSAVAVVVVSVAVRLQPVCTDVLVLQLSVRTGVPEVAPPVTEVHEAQVLVTVVELQDEEVDDGWDADASGSGVGSASDPIVIVGQFVTGGLGGGG